MGPPLFLLQWYHAWNTIITLHSSQLFSEKGNNLELQPRLMIKKQFFIFFFLHWEKLRNPARATVIIENKKGSLHKQKASHISNTMNEIFHYLKFYKFINELGKICFVQHWEKLHFETIMNWKCLMFLVW